MGKKASVFLSGFLGVILGCVITLGALVPEVNSRLGIESKSETKSNASSNADGSSLAAGAGYIDLYKNIAKTAMPSVVGITSISVNQSGDIYDFLFGEGNRTFQIVGTGVIVDEKGYIITNSHVVDDGNVSKVTVLLNDGSSLPANVLWNDQNLDLAILKIDGKDYRQAKLGDSDKVEVGDIAVAIGNPMGLDFERSVTQGIISGVERTIASGNISMNNLIQTDASINQGNSGGPLLNANGEVIGINTIKVGGEGLGFSIPINTAKVFINMIKENKVIKDKAVLGITGISMSQFKNYKDFKLLSDTGVLVGSVEENTPAYRSGIKQGDCIIALNSNKVKNMSDLIEQLYIAGQSNEKTMMLTVISGKAKKDVKVDIQRDETEKQNTIQNLLRGLEK